MRPWIGILGTGAAALWAAAAAATGVATTCARDIDTLQGAIERTRLDPQEQRAADAAMAAAHAALEAGDSEACAAHLHEVKLILHLEH